MSSLLRSIKTTKDSLLNKLISRIFAVCTPSCMNRWTLSSPFTVTIGRAWNMRNCSSTLIELNPIRKRCLVLLRTNRLQISRSPVKTKKLGTSKNSTTIQESKWSQVRPLKKSRKIQFKDKNQDRRKTKLKMVKKNKTSKKNPKKPQKLHSPNPHNKSRWQLNSVSQQAICKGLRTSVFQMKDFTNGHTSQKFNFMNQTLWKNSSHLNTLAGKTITSLFKTCFITRNLL